MGLMKDTSLTRAAHNGHFATVRMLVEAGAEIDALDLGDNTALHWCARDGGGRVAGFYPIFSMHLFCMLAPPLLSSLSSGLPCADTLRL